MSLVIMALLGLQELQEEQIQRLIQNLADDSIEARETAESELYALGSVARRHLQRAIWSSDPEVRNRSRYLLLRLRWTPVVANLGIADVERQKKAYRMLLSAGAQVLPILRLKGECIDPIRTFRAQQIAEILDSDPVNGLRFGVIVDSPKAKLEGSIPGYEVFINTSRNAFKLDVAVDCSLKLPGTNRLKAHWTTGDSLENQFITLKPGEVYLKRRFNLLMKKAKTGGRSGWIPDKPGKWRLIPRYSLERRARDVWQGEVIGNTVVIVVRR